jgi:Glycosyl hydrolase family 26
VQAEPGKRYLGVVTPRLAAFDRATGVKANLTVRYLAFGRPFPLASVQDDAALGAETLIEILPRGVTLRSVALGRQDAWLRSVAAGIRASGDAVMLSFAPEANGPWYPWGYHHASPAQFIAAYRRVHNVITAAGARDVTWVWQVSHQYARSEPVRALWPGRRYVDVAGIDGYFESGHDTFGNLFGVTLRAIRRFSSVPALITETAAGQVAGQAAKIPSLFAGIRADHMLGLVWFDIAQHRGLHHQDWQLNGAGLAAFRKAAARIQR